jgi:NodT family efflux transporter outer membrane factor (OMF) lipoprotein
VGNRMLIHGTRRLSWSGLSCVAGGRSRVMSLCRFAGLILVLAGLAACVKVGPDFVRPDAAVSGNWLDAADDRISNRPVDYRTWWSIFDDPVLNRLIDTAYRENLSLRIAGVRVLEARAQLGIAIGGFYPQVQQATGYLDYNRVSERSPSAGFFPNYKYNQVETTLAVGWELDFWGKFRRAVESADASWMASLADYDSALVSLTADVAISYILIRTLEKRIEIARQSVDVQAENLRIAEVRFGLGTTSQRDVEQAKTILNDTKAAIPTLESQLRQAKNALSLLLGLPPGHLREALAGGSGIPAPPLQVAVGIPQDLLRRRPDVRSAEHQAEAQSARIGVARAALFPSFFLSGTFGFLSNNVGNSSPSDIFQWASREYTGGPSVAWNILNYGRLTNNVRVQDARFQQLLISYQNAVLQAQREVEDALSAFLRAEERARLLAAGAQAARSSLDLAAAQYREGVADFTTVLNAEQALLIEQDSLATTMGIIATSLVATYRALGGGWQIREGNDLVPDAVKEAMEKRTDWGDLLKPAEYVPADREGRRSAVRWPDW